MEKAPEPLSSKSPTIPETTLENLANKHPLVAKIILTIIFLLFVLTLIRTDTNSTLLDNTSKKENEIVSISPTPTPAPTSIPVTNFSVKAKLIYPTEFSSISESSPTIIGRINQPEELLLKSSFRRDNFVHYNSDVVDYGIEFYQGRAQNVTVSLDGALINTVYGFPQFPYILCKDTDENPITDKEACIKYRLSELPPLIFFVKPKTSLSNGPHQIEIKVGGKTFWSNFTVDTSLKLPVQELPKQISPEYLDQNFSTLPIFKNIFSIDVHAGHDNPVRNKLDSQLAPFLESGEYDLFNARDACPPGYHYPSEYLPLPLPSAQKKNVYYELFLPLRPNDLGLDKNRKVGVKFENSIFDLRFGSFYYFYFDEEILNRDGHNYTAQANHLYIPSSNLIFKNSGESIKNYLDTDLPVFLHYLEYMPTDYSGQIYKENMLLFRNVSSTSCDG